MKVHGNYDADGYAHLEQLVPREIAEALLNQFWSDLIGGRLPTNFNQSAVLSRPAMELHGANFPAITTFLWGLTPAISALTECELLPSYAFFRLYQKGDKLRVHRDRGACEHSLSLTLGYSDGEIWGFDVGHCEAQRGAGQADDFGKESFSTIEMVAGDGILYRGTRRRHGRLTANPNKWSAHLFLHWVDREGRHREHAFEGLHAAARGGE